MAEHYLSLHERNCWFCPEVDAPLPKQKLSTLEIMFQMFKPGRLHYPGRQMFQRLTLPVLDYGLLETVLNHPACWQVGVVQDPFYRSQAFYTRLEYIGLSNTGLQRLICFRGKDLELLLDTKPQSVLPPHTPLDIILRNGEWREQILDQLCGIQRCHSKAYTHLPGLHYAVSKEIKILTSAWIVEPSTTGQGMIPHTDVNQT